MNPKSLSAISYGVYIVTSNKGSRLNGQVANAVMQITSEPPAVAVSINKKNLTWEFINESRVFAVSMLQQDTPLDFIGRFGFKSGRDIDKLENVRYFPGQTGSPVVEENAAAWIEARVVAELDAGTHTIYLGQVVAGEVLNDRPLMTYEYYRQAKRGTTPRTAPTYSDAKNEAGPKTERYRCKVCGWIYDQAKGDPDGGIAPGTPFEQIPATWVCPVCGAAKSDFVKVD